MSVGHTRPTGTVTFLFSDIEGSTRLWKAHPETMKVALAEHDTIVRSAIESVTGYVFSTSGDAFSAAPGDHRMINAPMTQRGLPLSPPTRISTWPLRMGER